MSVKKHVYRGYNFSIHISGPIPEENDMYSISKCVLTLDYGSYVDDVPIPPPEPAVYYPSSKSAEEAMLNTAKGWIDDRIDKEKTQEKKR